LIDRCSVLFALLISQPRAFSGAEKAAGAVSERRHDQQYAASLRQAGHGMVYEGK
jgi:hypothetical protein